MYNKFKLNIDYNHNLHEEYKQLCMYVYYNGTPLPEGYKVLGVA